VYSSAHVPGSGTANHSCALHIHSGTTSTSHAHIFLLQLMPTREASFRLTAYCHRHEQHCPLKPERMENGLLGDMSGTTCVDFSSLGSKKQFRGDSAPIFAIWASWLDDEGSDDPCFDFIIQEITPRFDPDYFRIILPHWRWQTAALPLQLTHAICSSQLPFKLYCCSG
jgi:hypothetical protein